MMIMYSNTILKMLHNKSKTYVRRALSDAQTTRARFKGVMFTLRD